jgi:hypothetical protein
MAKHRAARSLRRIVPALIALAFAAALAGAIPASANSPSTFSQLHLVGQNSVVKFNCNFDVQRVDNVNGTVTGTIQGNAFPASLLGYFTIAHSTVHCDLLNSAGSVDLSGDITASADGPKVTTNTITVVVPYDVNGYVLCGSGTAVQNNGSTSTAVGCIHS